MGDRKPLVLAPDPNVPGDTSLQPQQLQPGDDLDIPLSVRVEQLELALAATLRALLAHGIAIPDEAYPLLSR